MKHLLYTLLGILLLAGCKEDKYNVIIPMSDIYLSAPHMGHRTKRILRIERKEYQTY